MILEVLANAIIRQEREIKVILSWKEEIKTVFVEYMIVYLENLKESTKNSCNLLVIIARLQHTRLVQESKSLSYIPKIKKWNLKLKHSTIYISTQKVKLLGINLTKYVQDIYEKNDTTLVKEMEE